jgi:hypothetical protein
MESIRAKTLYFNLEDKVSVWRVKERRRRQAFIAGLGVSC